MSKLGVCVCVSKLCVGKLCACVCELCVSKWCVRK